METVKFIGGCIIDFVMAVYISLFCKIDIPELDENTEAFYHK